MVTHPQQSLSRQRGAATGLVLIIIVVAALLWWFKPWEGMRLPGSAPEAEPRPVAARGTLAEDE